MRVFQAVLVSLSAASVFAASATTTAERTSVTGCHSHGSDIFCIKEDGEEVQVSATATPTTGIPAQYTGCHYHGTEMYVFSKRSLPATHSNMSFSRRHCKDADGNGAYIQEEAAEDEHNHSSEESSGGGEQNCHFHAGVEYVVICP